MHGIAPYNNVIIVTHMLALNTEKANEVLNLCSCRTLH